MILLVRNKGSNLIMYDTFDSYSFNKKYLSFSSKKLLSLIVSYVYLILGYER